MTLRNGDEVAKGLGIRRVLAVFALFLGSLSVEAVKPVQCLLISNSRQHQSHSPEDQAR